MDMSEKEVEQLARHLGHDVKTHKEFYRLAHSTVELSKISQLLMAVERGEVNKWQGKNLTDVSVEEFNDFDSPVTACTDIPVTECSFNDDETTASNDLFDDADLTSTANGAEMTMNADDCTLKPKNQRKGKKTPWTLAENEMLRGGFPLYLAKKVHTKRTFSYLLIQNCREWDGQ